MDLFTPLLVSLCISTPNAYNNACQKGAEATYIQSGWSEKAIVLQKGVASYGASKEKAIFGDKTPIVNSVFMAGIAVKNKKVNLNLPNLGLCDRFSTEIQPKNYGVKLEWSW